MNLKINFSSSLFAAITAVIIFPSTVLAQTETTGYDSTNEAINEAFFKNSPNFYNDSGLRRDIDFLLGPGSLFKNSFPENEIARDAELVNIVYQDILNQQIGNDSYIRTPDLPNPYTSSLMNSPRFKSTQLQSGTEFRFENLPPR
ncbi:MAG: hypothetical protein ACFB02_17990 [Mastigocoleus sp.]